MGFCTEAQTGKSRLDTHFSYVNTQLKSYVEDDNNILTEEDIVKAISFRGGIAGTTAVLVDATSIGHEKAINEKFKVVKTGSRSTHEIRWLNDRVKVIESSGISKEEEILKPILDNFSNNDLSVIREEQFRSEKAALWVKEGGSSDATAPVKGRSTKKAAYDAALQRFGVTQKAPANDDEVEIGPIADGLLPKGWAAYPGNSKFDLNSECLQKLYDLHARGKGKENKSKRVTAERALSILVDDVIRHDWEQRLTLTVPKIKTFFQKTPDSMKKMLTVPVGDKSDEVAIAEAEREEIQNERRQEEVDSLQDV